MEKLLAAILLTCAATARAQQPDTLETFLQAYVKQQQLMLTQYEKDLNTIMAGLKRQGDLDNLLILQSEIKRFNA